MISVRLKNDIFYGNVSSVYGKVFAALRASVSKDVAKQFKKEAAGLTDIESLLAVVTKYVEVR